MSIRLPQSLNDIKNETDTAKQTPDLIKIKINNLTASQRNRIITQYSAIDGSVSPDLQGVAASWTDDMKNSGIKNISSEIDNRYKMIRSRLVDQFFSHQLPGIQDSVITDVRKIVKLQSQIQSAAYNASRQIKLAIHKCNQLYPQPKANPKFLQIETNSLDNIQKMIEEDEPIKPPHCNSRISHSSVACILENTDNITADFSSHH